MLLGPALLAVVLPLSLIMLGLPASVWLASRCDHAAFASLLEHPGHHGLLMLELLSSVAQQTLLSRCNLFRHAEAEANGILPNADLHSERKLSLSLALGRR
jgi:hypothetical protein